MEAVEAAAPDEGTAVDRYGRDSLELARVANLSDAVFAIAMTLLAFKIEAPPEAVAATEVCRRWWHHMRDVMPTRADGQPASRTLDEVFHIDRS